MQGFDLAGALQTLSVAAIPVLFAITIHEVAHGWVARRCGDATALMAGRLTLNPVKHIDPIGTIAVPLFMLMMPGNFLFGWAKPVPVAFGNLNNPRRDMILVAAAGPAVNLVMATGWTILAALVNGFPVAAGTAGEWILRNCGWGIQINVILAVLNMLPIPPLDGGRVLAGLLPPRSSAVMDRIEPYGLVIVVVLLITGVLWRIMEPFIFFFIDIFAPLAGFG